MIRPPPRSTRTDTLFPYTTLFRSAGDAVDRFQVVLVVHPQLRPLVDRGDVETEAHVVALQQQAHAVPAFREHMAVAIHQFVAVPDDHCDSSLRPRLRSGRSEEHTSELQSLMRISYAVFCLKKKN